MKRLLLAAVLLAAPMSAWAQCMGSDRQAMSCVEGSQWNAELNACVPIVTG